MILSHLIGGIVWSFAGATFVFIGLKRMHASKVANKEGAPKDAPAPWLFAIGVFLVGNGVYHLIRAFFLKLGP